MDCTAFAGIVINAITLGAIVITAVIYGLQLRQMTKATEAADKSASAAAESVAAMKETAERQLRAYVQIVPVRIYGFNSFTPVVVQFVLENYGQTPAKELYITCHCFMGPPEIDQNFSIPSLRNKWLGPADVFPNGALSTDAKPRSVCLEKDAFKAEEIDDFCNHKTFLHIVGEAKYKDVFLIERKTQFFYSVITRNSVEDREICAGSKDGTKINVTMCSIGNRST